MFDVIVNAACEVRGNRDAEALLDRGADLHTALLNGEDVGLTSLELLGAATEVADRFDLRRHGIEDYLLRRRTARQWADLVNDFVDAQTEFTFYSSGSTGRPVPTRHALRHLMVEARELADELRDVTRVRLFVPPRHIYGFIWGVVFPSLTGLPVLDARVAPAPLAPGDLIVSYPDHWAFLAAGEAALPERVYGLCSTAPLPAQTALALRARGLAGLIEIYGSAQTAGVGWRADPASPYRLFHHWRDLAEATPAGPPARLARADDEAGAAVELQDRIERVDGRRFHVRGRLDQAVQVSGMNVYPRRVQAVLEQSEHVASARVRLDAQTGALAALIVPAAASTLDEAARRRVEAALVALCRAHLDAWERPLRFRFAAAVPVAEMGKEAPWA